jgi:hypothetical protein
MRVVRYAIYLASLLGMIVLGTGCSYDTAVQRLAPQEQAEFRAYKNVMNANQAWTYLGKTSPAERQAYLQEIGVARRFQALDPLDREAVLLGYPRQGMSVDALAFLWGEPYYKQGDARHHAQWHYWGSTMSLAMRGNDVYTRGNRVTVHLADGHVESWLDHVPTDDEKGGGRDGDRKSL